jgi:hypothetical protein
VRVSPVQKGIEADIERVECANAYADGNTQHFVKNREGLSGYIV